MWVKCLLLSTHRKFINFPTCPLNSIILLYVSSVDTVCRRENSYSVLGLVTSQMHVLIWYILDFRSVVCWLHRNLDSQLLCVFIGRCVVCLAEYEDQDVLLTLPYCGHNFHMACIDAWLKQHSTCPVCRISLSDYPDTKHTVPPLPSAVMIPPYSPEASISDPCHFLCVGTGHSPRPSEVLRNEPDQANQTVPGPSLDGPNNLTLSEVTSPGENNNQTVK
jgi:hypothetical protein